MSTEQKTAFSDEIKNKTTHEQIEHLKSLISHQNINPSYDDLMKIMLSAAIEKIEKKKGINLDKSNLSDKLDQLAETTEALNSTPPTRCDSGKSSRYIPRNVKRFVLNRSNGQCEHVNSDGRRCCSTFQSQFDHRVPFSKGGSRDFQNIQLLCRVYNSLKSDSVSS